MHTNALDEAIALPSASSSKIARATQLILQEETGITKVADPFGGSYMMESLTSDLMDKAMEIIDDVQELGGMAGAAAEPSMDSPVVPNLSSSQRQTYPHTWTRSSSSSDSERRESAAAL